MTTTNIDMDMSGIKKLSIVGEKVKLSTMFEYGWAFTWGVLVAIGNFILLLKFYQFIIK